MRVFKFIKDYNNYLSENNINRADIGFVPTMGALHQGHISLIKQSCLDNKVTVASIFVNPTQFNDKSDYTNYPRTPEYDLKKLEEAGCNVVFMPDENEVYINNVRREFNLGYLETIMEGEFRPGHFQGVAMVVNRLFDIIMPGKAYFGIKDFQQVAVIRKLVEITNSQVEIIPMPTLREFDGLAMSSRNARLSEKERINAGVIPITLQEVPELFKTKSYTDIYDFVKNKIENTPFLRLEYFKIVDSDTLLPYNSNSQAKALTACIAVFCGNVRLIDNIHFCK